MNENNVDILLKSNHIFTSTSNPFTEGYIAISGNRIIDIGKGEKYKNLINKNTKIFDITNKLITPGFVDVHTFFTGYVVSHLGMDMSFINSKRACIEAIKEYAENSGNDKIIFGHGWNPNAFDVIGLKNELSKLYPERSIILFSKDRGTCIMNEFAIKKYGFTADSCYPESYYRIMREYLNDRSFMEKEFNNYMKLMNSRGVTSVKEMGFDDFYGFTDFLQEKEQNEELTLRTFFMSQPVGEGINIEYAKAMCKKFKNKFVRFSGFNRMTDGTIASKKADLLEPYKGTDMHCGMEIDYDLVKSEVIEADKHGFRYSLHAQGDGAIHKVLGIYEECRKKNGKCLNRHVITDLEFTNPKDLERMGRLGVIAEIYPQIMSLDSGDVTRSNIMRTIGEERARNYWNRKKMIDSGVTISCGTDLPLMITSIPESIYYTCGGYFPEGGQPFNKQNTISIEDLLKAWTIGGQYNLGMEKHLGTLEVGKHADIAVLDTNVFEVPIKEVRDAEVCLTISDGRIVYNKLN